MATFKQYKKKNGDTAWKFSTYLGVDYATGKQINTTRRGFKTKKEAQSALNRLLLDFETGNSQAAIEVTKFEEIYEMWFEVYKTTVKKVTYEQTDRRMRKYILPTFGPLIMERIDLMTCQKVVNKWAKSFGMYTELLRYVTKVGDYAVRLEVIKSNPFSKVEKPKKLAKERESKIKFYTREQLEHFFEQIEINIKKFDESQPVMLYYSELDRAIFRILAFTGLRVSEALALNWNDIDESEASISINKNLSGFSSDYEVSTTKTKKSNRNIPIDAKTLQTLKKWRLRQRQLLLTHGVTNINLIFSDIHGELMFRTDIYQRSRRIAEKAKLPNIGCHGFRHTHATLMYEAGADLKDIQNRLGHSELAMTADIYTHLSKKTEKETVQKFARYIQF